MTRTFFCDSIVLSLYCLSMNLFITHSCLARRMSCTSIISRVTCVSLVLDELELLTLSSVTYFHFWNINSSFSSSNSNDTVISSYCNSCVVVCHYSFFFVLLASLCSSCSHLLGVEYKLDPPLTFLFCSNERDLGSRSPRYCGCPSFGVTQDHSFSYDFPFICGN